MNWREFELECQYLIRNSLNPNEYRIETQYSRDYSGQNLRMDFHIAERRQGGKGYVIDCKHYQQGMIPAQEINSLLNYMNRCRASKGIILLSQDTVPSNAFINRWNEVSDKISVVVVRTDRIGKLLNSMKLFFRKELINLDFIKS